MISLKMGKIKTIISSKIGPLGGFDYGVFIVFLIVTTLFILTVVQFF